MIITKVVARIVQDQLRKQIKEEEQNKEDQIVNNLEPALKTLREELKTPA